MLRLAIVGDVHGHWRPADAAWFDQAGYDRVLVVGDLAGLRWSKTLEMARALAQMRAPAIVVPGNHDATHAVQLLGEVIGRPGLVRPLTGLQGQRLARFREALGDHELGAYSQHVVGTGEQAITVIAGRPHSMGGPTLAFPGHLAAVWGITSLEVSAERLRGLVDSAPTKRLVFVAHNGPTGLGDRRIDPFGCDFKAEQGDWGDPDLRDAVEHARQTGKQVLAVVAGHMHRGLKGGGRRSWQVRRDGVLYVNAAEVPRVERASGRRHHVALQLDGTEARAADRWIGPEEASP